MQKWYLMKAKSVPQIEASIDLTGLGGASQEFGRYAWFHIEDMLPLCRDFKRGAYAHVIREMQPLIAAGKPDTALQGRDAVEISSSEQPHTAPETESVNDDCQSASPLEAAIGGYSLLHIVTALVQAHGKAAVLSAVDGIDTENSKPDGHESSSAAASESSACEPVRETNDGHTGPAEVYNQPHAEPVQA